MLQRDRVQVIVAVVGLVFVAVTTLIGDVGVVRFLNRPRLSTEILPAYTLSAGRVSGIIVRNSGSAPAEDVVVTVWTGDQTILDVVSTTPWTDALQPSDGGIGKAYVTYSPLYALAQRELIGIYILTKDKPEMTVKAQDQTGLAISAERLSYRPWYRQALERLGLVLFIYVLVYLIYWTARYLSGRT